jgi:hypothetical protein
MNNVTLSGRFPRNASALAGIVEAAHLNRQFLSY